MERHPGIRIDKIPVAGAAGLIFVVGILAIAFFGLPSFRSWFLISVVGGVVGAGILRLWYEYR
jgi:hypothetical protein